MIEVSFNWLSLAMAEAIHWIVTAPIEQVITAHCLLAGGLLFYMGRGLFIALQRSRSQAVELGTVAAVDVPINRLNDEPDYDNEQEANLYLLAAKRNAGAGDLAVGS